MADEYTTPAPPLVTAPPAAPPRRGAGRAMLGAALIAFILGAAAVGYAAWEGVFPAHRAVDGAPPIPAPSATTPAIPREDPAALAAHQGELESRMIALEQRLAAVNTQADAASGNAARAEALLVAFAARRAVDRGAPLGYLEDQLRLRFGNAQPNAVAKVIDAGRAPVTLEQLLAGLDGLAPTLTQAPSQASAWTKVKRELAGLFIIRHEAAPSPVPQVMLQRARLLLEAGRTGDAIAMIQRLPGSADAGEWFTLARRHDDVQRALDVLETTAMLDTRSLRDAEGRTVDQPAPVGPTAPAI